MADLSVEEGARLMRSKTEYLDFYGSFTKRGFHRTLVSSLTLPNEAAADQ